MLAGRARETEINFLVADTYGSLACEFSTLFCVFKDQLSVFADSPWDAKVCRWRLSGPGKRLRSLYVLNLGLERGWREESAGMLGRAVVSWISCLISLLRDLSVWMFISVHLCSSLQFFFSVDFHVYPFICICACAWSHLLISVTVCLSGYYLHCCYLFIHLLTCIFINFTVTTF